jgi:RNA polymerase sigma-70 factor (ECF subfamily)
MTPATLGDQFEGVLRAACTGAEWAWDLIYDSLAGSVLGYLRARAAPDPEGVCGEVFCQLVRDIHRFEGDEAGFRSWVFVMTHHRLLDDVRRRSRRPEGLTQPEELEVLVHPGDVEHEVMVRTRERELRAVIEELTPPQRDVLLLRLFGGLTVEEVAQAVGRQPGAVKALQRRGLESLRTKLEASGYLSESPGR